MAKNATTLNRTKAEKHSKQHVIPSQNVHSVESRMLMERLLPLSEACGKQNVLYWLGRSLADSLAADNDAYSDFVREYDFDFVDIGSVPTAPEFDLLGSVYQYLNTKTENLEQGSFYTGRAIAEDFTRDLDFSDGQDIFDPACGSGVFLFAANAGADQLHGIDADPVAVMIAKFNYFLKFSDAEYPDIHCQDFFEWLAANSEKRFDYVIGNPPYGADIELPVELTNDSCVSTGESFSYFIEYCFPLATDVFRFLVPEALLNVKRHADIRSFILNESDLIRIKKYPKNFGGVLSDTYLIEMEPILDEEAGHDAVVFEVDGVVDSVPKRIYKQSSKTLFLQLSSADISIIEKVEKRGNFHLPAGAFALGIVTGGNKDLLLPESIAGSEPIYTGKEITGRGYKFLPAKNYIVYDRKRFQQVAPDRFYRTKPKLVYKSVCNYLKFVIDKTGALTTNTASIVLPEVDGFDPYVVLGLLNSRIFSFYHYKMFGGVNKIHKENLMAMPLPMLKEEEHRRIEVLVGEILKGVGEGAENADRVLQRYIEEGVYGLSAEERRRLDEVLPF